MVERFQETRHLVVKSASALSRGILRRKNNGDTTHFNADAPNTELLFRTIHSANQLSIHEAVSSWCEEFGRRPNTKQWTSDKFASKINEEILKSVNSQEVNSLVRTRRTGAPVSGNGLRECLQNFESLEKSLRFTNICDRVSIGMCYTISDVRDGLRTNTSMPRVCTPSCRQRFQSLCSNSMKNIYWTSHSSSHHTKSWQSWTCNPDSIPDKPRSKILGGDMRREESLRGRVTSPKSRTQSHQF